jgi:hypothetical protein
MTNTKTFKRLLKYIIIKPKSKVIVPRLVAQLSFKFPKINAIVEIYRIRLENLWAIG